MRKPGGNHHKAEQVSDSIKYSIKEGRQIAQVLAGLCFVVSGAHADTPPNGALAPEKIEFFEKQVRPLLAENCLGCHGANSKPLMGNLRLDTRAGLLKGGERGPSLTPKQPETSLLLSAIRYTDKNLQMPPKGKLSDAQIAVLTEWVTMGAPFPEAGKRAGALLAAPSGKIAPNTIGNPQSAIHNLQFDLQARKKAHWAWQPVRSQTVPPVKRKNWGRNPVDNFVLARLEAKGLTPALPADKRTLLRRVTYDLIGLPPTPAELHDFLNDTSPNAYEKVVDRLLASPHYGERWARHWLDLVRYAETDGHEWDMEKTGAWQYRDYVVRALNADVPYNQFVQEQIAGDLLPQPRLNPAEHFNEALLGTGFFWLGSGTHSPVDLREEEATRIDNQIDVFGKTFLGMGVGCARCHDHKFDAISTKDYYALYGIFKCSRQQMIDTASPLTDAQRRDLRALNAKIQEITLQGAAKALAWSPDLNNKEWNASVEAARNNPAAFLHPWAVLSAPDVNRSPDTFRKAREELRRRLQEQTERAQRETQAITWILGPEAGAKSSEWTGNGEAFDAIAPAQEKSAPTGPQTLQTRPDPDKNNRIAAAYAATMADSGLLSAKLHGSLRSPTFTIEKPHILYQIMGKDARIRVVIDGYQRIRDPLYGGLEFAVDSPTRPTWREQDVRAWIGHRAYIELADESEGFLAVQRIGFGENGPPVETPDPLALRILDDATVNSSALLSAKYAALYREAARVLEHGLTEPGHNNSGHGTNVGRDFLPFLQWALPTIALPPADASALAALMEQRRRLEAALPAPTPALAAADSAGENERVHLRGNYHTPGPEAPRRFLEACSPASASNATATFATKGSGRLELAQRLTSASNPLFARVLVNRVWQHHFGEGLVRTPDDFGVMGQSPTHPELLDWLANHFVAKDEGGVLPFGWTPRMKDEKNGASSSSFILHPSSLNCAWSLKKLHRLMVLSSAYRMDSRVDKRAEALDPQNKLLHHIPVRRLEAEGIRDGILAVSGRLDAKVGGPSVMPHLTAFTPGRGAPSSGPLDGDGRRSLYISVRRNFPLPLFMAFDYPVPTTTIGRRAISSVPAQALALLNDPFVAEQAGVWAKRVLAQPGEDSQRITDLYETAFARTPTPAERDAALAFLAQQAQQYGKPDDPRAWTDLCHVLFNVKEFIFVR